MTTCQMSARLSSECKSHTAGNVSVPSISSLTYMSSETTSSLWTSSWCRWSHSWCWPPLTSPCSGQSSAQGWAVRGQAKGRGPGRGGTRASLPCSYSWSWCLGCVTSSGLSSMCMRCEVDTTFHVANNIFCRWLWWFKAWVMATGPTGAPSWVMSPTSSLCSTARSTSSSTAGKTLPSGAGLSGPNFTKFLFHSPS